MKKALLGVAALAVAWFAYQRSSGDAVTNQAPPPAPASQTTVTQLAPDNDAAANAFENRARGVQVKGEGVVVRVLPDDTEGGRHQRFILRLSSGQTVLIAHNIDLAPRVDALQSGAAVSFNGEYEWNERGGVIHWTHHDPAGRHAAGWLRYAGKTYQ